MRLLSFEITFNKHAHQMNGFIAYKIRTRIVVNSYSL